MILEQAIQIFLGEYPNLTTRSAYWQTLREMQSYVGPKRPVADVRPADLIGFAQQLRTRNLAAASMGKHIKTMRTFFNWLIKIEEIVKSPASSLKMPRVKPNIDKNKAMTDDELHAILEYVRWNPRNHALVLFLADTGCRAGGAATLTIDALDLENKRAEVVEKGDKRRPVAYGETCHCALCTWLAKRPPNSGVYVFSRDGGELSAAAVSQIVRRACKRVGIRSLGSHSLRHRLGHKMADDKVAVSVTATILGHQDPAITLRHYYPHDWERAEAEIRRHAVGAEPEVKIVKLRDAQ